MKGVHTLFLFRAEAAALVAAGMQILLHRFANRKVLALDLVAELDGLLGRFSAYIFLRQIPLEDGETAVWGNRQHDIERDVIRITVQHPVRKCPEVIGREVFSSFLVAAWRCVSGLRTA